jgi:hypothetical protein
MGTLLRSFAHAKDRRLARPSCWLGGGAKRRGHGGGGGGGKEGKREERPRKRGPKNAVGFGCGGLRNAFRGWFAK